MADQPDLMPLVDLCLRRLRAGESLDACLADYPAEAAALRPLLETALILRAVSTPPVPDPARRAANRARFLSQAAALSAPVPVDIGVALDACLLRLRAGEPLDGVLADYPTQADALRPLIATALTMRTVPAAPPPDPVKRAAYRERFLTLAAALLGATARVSANGHAPQPAQPAPAAPWYRRAYAAIAAFLAQPGYGRRVGLVAAGLALVLVVGASGVLAVSAESLPGDPLYPVKEVSRSVELALTFTPEARAAVLEKQDSEKQTEIVLLQERSTRPAMVAIPAFSDILVSVDADGVWMVGRVRVRVSPDMLAQIGSRVRISGQLGPDGVVDATQVIVLASPPGAVKLAQQPTVTTAGGGVALPGRPTRPQRRPHPQALPPRLPRRRAHPQSAPAAKPRRLQRVAARRPRRPGRLRPARRRRPSAPPRLRRPCASWRNPPRPTLAPRPPWPPRRPATPSRRFPRLCRPA
ncbi:MAG: DUF5667 domain-containing protein [Anaerolineae bacterium]